MSRYSYLRSLDGFELESASSSTAAWRHPVPADLEVLAALMLDAYRGTIDDDGETIDDARQEVESYFAGDSGTILPECSWLLLENGRILCACLTSLWEEIPLIAYIMTAAANKGRGLARQVLNACLASLKAAGHTQVRAVITHGNIPSEKLFTRSGFIPETS